MDYFGGTFIIVFLASFEMIAISWVYGNNFYSTLFAFHDREIVHNNLSDFPGVDNFMDDIEFMVGQRPSFYWRFCWCYLTPLSLFTILIYFLISMTPLMYNDEYYPSSAYGTDLNSKLLQSRKRQDLMYYEYIRVFCSRGLDASGFGGSSVPAGHDGRQNSE